MPKIILADDVRRKVLPYRKTVSFADCGGDPNIGLYGFATDSFCLLGKKLKKQKMLKVKCVKTSLLGLSLAGVVAAGNSSGLVVPELAEEDTKLPTLKLDTRYTALGNLILMNDNGILISNLIKKHKAELEEFFGLPVKETTIAGLDVIGSVGFCTNSGCLTSPDVRKNEITKIEKTLGVPVSISTVLFGSPFVSAGLIANKNALLIADTSSGIEAGKIAEGLGFR
jgi:translation initiation factor 6